VVGEVPGDFVVCGGIVDDLLQSERRTLAVDTSVYLTVYTYESATVCADNERQSALPVMAFRCEYAAWKEGGTTWVGFDLVWLGAGRQIRRVTNVEGGVDDRADTSVLDVF
jgi:hypothetical protein